MEKHRRIEGASIAPWIALALGVAGCGGEPQPTARPKVTLGAGQWEVRVDPDRKDLVLAHGDEVLLDFPTDGFELGSVPQVDDATNYDPYRILVPSALYPSPADITWLTVERVDIAESSAKALSLRLSYGGGKAATLRVEASAEGRFSMKLVPDAAGPSIAYFRLRPRIDAKEGLYGLGEQFDDVDQRGKVRAMQIELDSSIESTYNEVHVPIPLLIGTRGWGLYVDSARPGVFALGTESPTLADVMFGTGTASGDGLSFHLLGAPHPLDVTKHYYDLTGYPRLPARWALGPWVWRDENKDQAEAQGDVEAMRTLDLPATGYWIDRPYATDVNTFDFNPGQFPAPQAMIDKMHDLGFRVALWHVPYEDKDAPATKPFRDEIEKNGYLPPKTGLPLNQWGTLLDLTNEKAYAWWQGLIEKYTAMGVEGFKLDYAEDVNPGITPARNEWRFADGSDERTMHQLYQLFYHRVYAETLPADGGFLLCRHATIGDQKNGPIIWPGDLDASFAKHREKVTEANGDSYVAVGGLPASLVAGLSLGPSGFPFFGSDTGGYRHSPPDKELFTRWFEQTALSSVMQIGNSASTVAWEPDPATGYDAEMLGWYRTYTRLHLRLWPYEWTYANRLLQDGRPVTRALGLAYPELGVHPNDEYLFGDDLLVAPVVERGAVKRKVIVPPGRWIDWWTGEALEGGQTVEVSAPLGKLPLYLREGGVVPLLRPTIDTLAPTTKPAEVDSYATTPGVLWARVALGDKNAFVLFDGAEVAAEKTADGAVLSSKDGKEFAQGAMFEVVAFGSAPSAVEADGMALPEMNTLADLEAAPAGWFFAADVGGTLHVKVGPGGHVATVKR
jgi:alpha-D-xyloside xylohydrolase